MHSAATDFPNTALPALDILKATRLFSELDSETLQLFASKGITKHYPKGKVLFLHEDKAEYFYVIAHGWVKLFRETLDGNEAVIDVLNRGHMFGETAIFEQDTYSYSAEVVEHSTLLLIPIALLKEQIASNSQLVLKLLSVMSRFRRQQDKELEHRDQQNAPQRIGCFLLRLCKAGDEKVTLHLPYDKTLIASRLGMKPETFSRALARLKEETSIRVIGAMVEIDNVQKLSVYCCNACSSSFPCEDLH